MRNAAIPLLVILLLGQGCLNEESSEGQGDVILRGDGRTDLETQDDECPGLQNLTGRAYRVVAFPLHKPLDQVKSLWNTAPQAVPPLLIHVREHDQGKGVLHLSIGPARIETQDDGEGYPVPISHEFAIEPFKFMAKLNGCEFTIDVPIVLQVMDCTMSKPLVIADVTGSGVLSKEGGKIVDGILNGVIHEVDTFELCVLVPDMGNLNYHHFLNMAMICPNVDTTGDEKCDSYAFAADYTAEDETALFNPESITPIETVVKECPSHFEECVDECISCIEYPACTVKCGFDQESGMAGAVVDCPPALSLCLSVDAAGGELLSSGFAQCEATPPFSQFTPTSVTTLECCHEGLMVDCKFDYEMDGTVKGMTCDSHEESGIVCQSDNVPECLP